VNGVDVIVAQQEAIARAGGASAEETEAARAAGAKTMPLARAGDEDALEAALRETYGAYWDRRSADERVVLGERDAFVSRQVEAAMPVYLSDWFRSLLAYDPAVDWRRVQVPVLGLYGGLDVQVLEPQNAPALRDALEAGGAPDVEIVTIADANHLFQAAETGAVQEYGTLASEFHADVLPTLVDWITGHAGLTPQG
jgi:pimeloyl-ACP methyl ester carboxylesterase